MAQSTSEPLNPIPRGFTGPDAPAESETSIVVTISSDYNETVNATYTSRTTVINIIEVPLSNFIT